MKVQQAAADLLASIGQFDVENNGWRKYALCNQLPPEAADELFFSSNRENLATAKMYCRECPVIQDCLDWAFENNVTEGVWGGTTPADRGKVGRHEFDSAYWVKFNDGTPYKDPNPEWEYILYPERRPRAKDSAT